MYTLKDISQAIRAELHGNGLLSDNWRLLIDSRTLTHPETSIFFAIHSKFNDGHNYIDELITKGVKTFVVEHSYAIKHSDVNFLKVDNVIMALQELAKFHRNQFDIPVIGITGSNGKTIVKEWLNYLMGEDETICASPKSFNSQIGVPLSVWQLQPEHTLAIFEAGISAKGEMQNLAEIIQPRYGIITHLGPAHNQGFDTPEEKIREKLLLFEHSELVFTQYQPAVTDKLTQKVICFGYNQPKADLNIITRKIVNKVTQITGIYNEQNIAFSIPFTDEASIENSCLCALVCLHFGHFNADKMMHLSPVGMRLELKKGINNCLLINDSYSNDLHALGTALSFLEQQAIHSKTTVIISDIEESGLPAEILYVRVKQMLNEKKVNRLIAIGPEFKRSFKDANAETEFYDSTEDFLKQFSVTNFRDESILVKGARKFKFELIAKKLEQTSHGTILEINLNAALHNLNAIKSHLGKDMKIMAMVKAFAYGSGTYEMAKLIRNKVDYLAVAYADEGVALRNNGIQTPIMVMNPEFETFDFIVNYQLEPVVFSLHQLNELIVFLKSKDLQLPVHIELDTGMHRLGFAESDIEELKQIVTKCKEITIASVFSHLSASDEQQYDEFTKQQFQLFHSLSKQIESALDYPILKHISNTAAALRFSQSGLDMVRLGIGLYGIDPTGEFKSLLEPVFTLKTVISQIKTISANESVGYSRKSISNHSRRIAVMALGYADGLNRALSNGVGGLLIRGKWAPIAGNICMDMCMVDVTDIECEEGDEAIVFGRELSIEQLAEKLNTIPYEILTSISQRVKRVYVSE